MIMTTPGRGIPFLPTAMVYEVPALLPYLTLFCSVSFLDGRPVAVVRKVYVRWYYKQYVLLYYMYSYTYHTSTHADPFVVRVGSLKNQKKGKNKEII